jgi:hypothetical protein
MKYRSLLATVFLLLLAAAAHAATWSVAEHRERLRDLTQKVESLQAHPEMAARIAVELPEKITVRVDKSEYPIDFANLKSSLGGFSTAAADKRPALLQQIKDYVQMLNQQADAFAKAGPDLESDRAKLSAILAGREYAKVKSPNAWDRFLSKAYGWITRQLNKLFSIKGLKGETQLIVVYIVIGIAFSVLAIWIVRRLSQPLRAEPEREIMPFAPSAKGWRTWLAEARALAQEKDWRSAIHLSYWAGISFLEEHGAWKPDRARTPREYLRLLSARSEQHPVLAALTGKFEVVWYGHRDAGEIDFQETLGQLEKLGCR